MDSRPHCGGTFCKLEGYFGSAAEATFLPALDIYNGETGKPKLETAKRQATIALLSAGRNMTASNIAAFASRWEAMLEHAATSNSPDYIEAVTSDNSRIAFEWLTRPVESAAVGELEI